MPLGTILICWIRYLNSFRVVLCAQDAFDLCTHRLPTVTTFSKNAQMVIYSSSASNKNVQLKYLAMIWLNVSKPVQLILDIITYWLKWRSSNVIYINICECRKSEEERTNLCKIWILLLHFITLLTLTNFPLI